MEDFVVRHHYEGYNELTRIWKHMGDNGRVKDVAARQRLSAVVAGVDIPMWLWYDCIVGMIPQAGGSGNDQPAH